MATRTYSLDEVVLTIGGRRITEFADGDAIEVELDDDDWAAIQGSHGAVLRARKHNALASATLRLVQGSPDNRMLSDFATYDYRTGKGAKTFHLQDARAKRTLVTGKCWVKKRPAVKFAAEGGQVEWPFAIAIDSYYLGEQDQA